MFEGIRFMVAAGRPAAGQPSTDLHLCTYRTEASIVENRDSGRAEFDGGKSATVCTPSGRGRQPAYLYKHLPLSSKPCGEAFRWELFESSAFRRAAPSRPVRLPKCKPVKAKRSAPPPLPAFFASSCRRRGSCGDTQSLFGRTRLSSRPSPSLVRFGVTAGLLPGRRSQWLTSARAMRATSRMELATSLALIICVKQYIILPVASLVALLA